MKPFAPLALLLVGGCQQQQAATPANEPTDPVAAASPAPSPTEAPSVSLAQSSHYDSPTLTPEAEKSEKGVRNVLLSWAAAMEDRDFDAARRMFGDFGGRSGMDARTFALSYDYYGDIQIGFGDGAIEGAAGSLYYQVPVWMRAKGSDGPERREGTITLRRVNDVPGADPEELRWHIEKLDW